MDFEDVLKSTVLEALIEKVTNIQNKNNNQTAINAFTKIITDEPECVSVAVQLIISKMQSTNEWEVLQTLHLLEACVESSQSPMLAEIGKFRFLNEMIKLVSPKYLGNNSPTAVKNKIVDLLRSWSYKYSNEIKIKEAYEMLLKQGVVDTNRRCDVSTSSFSHSQVENCSRSVLYEDDVEKSKLLQKLLRSNKPEDLRAANHLIKEIVKEKETKEHLGLLNNNVKLLYEMLLSITSDTSEEDFQLIRELKTTCDTLRPTLMNMIEVNAVKSRDSPELAELIDLSDFLHKTLFYYFDVMTGDHSTDPRPQPSTYSNSITEVSSPTPIDPREQPPAYNSRITQIAPPALLDFGSLIDDDPLTSTANSTKSTDRGTMLTPEPAQTVTAESSVDTLNDIFNSTFSVLHESERFDKPVESENKVVNSAKLFQDLNALGKSLLEQPKSEDNAIKDVTKITLNDLAAISNKAQGSISKDEQLLNDDDNHDDDDGDDDKLMNGNEITQCEIWTSKLDNNEIPSHTDISYQDELNEFVEPLSDISVPLMEIKTEPDEKLTAFEDPTGITVCIQLTKNKPRKDVSVFLVLANSRKSESITNFLFQPVVSKDCRLKLLPPSRNELPPYNPYIPIDTIMQIMLIASFKKDYIPLKFVISYNMQDEMITEMGEMTRLPLK